MEKLEGKLAIVTGTTSGIGKAITTQLVEAGLRVVGLARREERGKELALSLEGKKGKFYHVTADITREEDILKSFQWIKSNVGPVHILINNAGTVNQTTLLDGETRLWKDIFDTNVLGLCMMTREAVKMMRADNINGQIVHIGSLGGHKVLPLKEMSVYWGSKFAVTALTETLRQELNQIGSGIRISVRVGEVILNNNPGFQCISPGVVETELFQRNEDLKNAGLQFQTLKAEDIADIVSFILTRPSHVQIHDVIVRPIDEEF